MREPASPSRAAIHISTPPGIMKSQGKRTMMKNLALAASIMMLVAFSGQAFAATATPDAQHQTQVTGLSTFAAFDQAATADEPDMHRYFGGPKSND
jgi:hypothetical protein